MNNPDSPTNTLRWHDLPGVTATIQSHGSIAAKCVLEFEGQPRACVLLMAEGIFSRVAHALDSGSERFDDVFVGLGRVISSHSAQGLQLLGDDALQKEIRHVEDTGLGPMNFDSLPEVAVTIGIREPEFVECTLRFGLEAALVVLVLDENLPFAWVRFSTPEPDRPLLSGLGRLLVAHFAEGKTAAA
jgi:hypothetical protein